MRLEEVYDHLERVEEYAAIQDNEAAHMAEDQLHRRVLWAIADYETGDSPDALAAAALETRGMKFPRKYA